ncbi:MAG TPA: hypothetical protein DF774_07505 [Rheinheimera sp.]|uniref:DUF799 domain-containing protein n=1 Tax=unclassified Rheinheimera TaxID=115860 RepID=UPI000EC0FDD0|nr:MULTISPECIES: DUF799 domain-containing protein [unclassified Rheinheimera]MCT6698047.1 DUF799 domain-containing protein [Rheinheimera sp. 4Y26]HCU65586.1 hypothetical protein [Rheinheimera sp.]
MKQFQIVAACVLSLILAGCAGGHSAMDYSAFKQSKPKSILVLPPVNHTTEVLAPYGVLANVTVPLAEAGYYVFPVALVDETFKNNGLTVAEDIHAVSLKKLNDIFGADAVMYLEVQQYGTSYVVLASDTVVEVQARLVDSHSNAVLWQGKARAASSEQNGGNRGGVIGMLVEAAVTQILETALDASFEVASTASVRLFSPESPTGLLYGPRSPHYGKDKPPK